MIVDKKIEIMTCGKSIKYYRDLGYDCGYRTKIFVSQLDLPKGSMQKVEVVCDYCGNHFYAKMQDLSRSIINKHACKLCASKKAKESNLKHFGAESYLGTKEGLNRYKQTCLKKYGVDNPTKNKNIKNKQEQTNLQKYGFKNVFQNEEIKQKIKQTCLDKYGVDNPQKSTIIREKTKNTCLKKYGSVSPSGSTKIKQKIKNTNLQRYGVDHPMQNKSIHEKQENTVFQKYGVTNIMHCDYFKQKALNKLKETSINIYGIYPASKSSIVKDKIKESFVSSHEACNIPSSKNQVYLCNLYNGILNYPMKYYFLDMLLGDNIYCEYDGSGHNLNVMLGHLTQKEFDKKETIRYYCLKSCGLKMFKIIHKGNKLPSDKKLLHIKQLATQLLLNTNNNWVVFDIDKDMFETKKSTIKYNENLSVL